MAVVGAGLGGLAAAALLSKKGKKVILLEPSEDVGGAVTVHSSHGFRFATGTTLSFGLERGGTLDSLYSELGIAQSASMLSPSYQVALPDRRINVYAEKDETQEELRREFPGEIEQISTLYRNVRKSADRIAKNKIYSFFANHRRAGSLLSKYHFSPELLVFFNLQSLFFFYQPIQHIRAVSLVTLIDSAPFSIHGGMKRVAENMLDAFLRNGGEIRYGFPWPELIFAHKYVSGLSRPEGLIEADAFLFNTRQDHSGTTLFLGVRNDVVPVGMSDELLCFLQYPDLNRVFSISLSRRDDNSTAPDGMRAVTVIFPFLPAQSGSPKILLDQVGRLIPFLKDHLIVIEEQQPERREFSFPESLSFKPVPVSGHISLLKRSAKNIFLINDGAGTLLQAISAARQFVDLLL